jgi:beta-barrel assembly-enhancing protease
MGQMDKTLYSRRAVLGGLLSLAVPTAVQRLLADEPRITVPAYNTLSDEEEISLGRTFARKLEGQVEIVHNPLVERYLNSMVSDLASVSQRPNLPYNAKLVNSLEINAFSIPGGNVYVNRGLVEAIGSEDELAATLSHEIGDIVGRHVTNQLLLSFRARQVYQLVRNNLLKNNEEVAKVIDRLGGAVAMLALLHLSREDEFEADMLGFYEMVRAKYQPKGFIDLFGVFEELERRQGSSPSPFLRDHPPTPDRDARIRREMAQVQLSNDMRSDTLAFHAFKTAMNLVPTPRKKA